MRKKRIHKYIDILFEEKEKYINGAEFWNKVANALHRLEALEDKVVRLESVVNTMWSLPMFKEYRGR